MTNTPDSASSPPDNEPSGEWIKDVVAQALLQATQGEPPVEASAPVTPLDPTPTMRAPSDWPTMSATVPAPSEVPELPPLEPFPIQRRPTHEQSAPAHVPVQDDVVRAISAQEAPEGATLPVMVQDRTPEADDHDDEVMVETVATTEGYKASDLRTILEWLAVIIAALAVALLIKAFVLQAFWIPSPSMETTVNRGDRILVNKVSYKLHEVRRGDLVVFERLEGTPGNIRT